MTTITELSEVLQELLGKQRMKWDEAVVIFLPRINVSSLFSIFCEVILLILTAMQVRQATARL